jgi:integrase
VQNRSIPKASPTSNHVWFGLFGLGVALRASVNRQTGFFASRVRQGKFPFWGQALLRHYIRPAAVKVGITKRIGWHTFRHSYSTLLKASGADIKVMQELLRHASTRVTLDTYTQVVTPAKRAAQTAVVTQFFPSPKTA